ncbi:MAG: hypothetical protein JOZ27_02960 [Caulobacteraceae bacterium]|nr:hypothetical protein [Caulobacteraceae bacterium]
MTLNGGATWSSWFNQPTGQFYHVAADNAFPYRVYGSQQDSGAAGVDSRTGSLDAIDSSAFHELAPGGESDSIAPDPKDPQVVYGGRVTRLDRRTGQVSLIDPTMAAPGAWRTTWTLPLRFSADGRTLFFSNQKVFRTVDGGGHWEAISPDLTRADPPPPPNLDAPTLADSAIKGPRRGVVYSLGPSPLDPAALWAGTDDGLVWRTSDGGRTWRDVTPAALGAWSKIASVEPSHFSGERAYIAVDRHRLDDPTPYIYRTRDGGRSWSPIVAGLGGADGSGSVNVIREDPVKAGLLYAGAERGVFVSLDDGEHWSRLGRGLPATSVRDIVTHGDDLVIATHGRGFYILDAMSALRQIGAAAPAGPRLYAPGIAVRFRPSGFTGPPKPKDEPMAPDAPNGAPIDYYLPADAAGAMRLEILASSGEVVRRYDAGPAPEPPDPATQRVPAEWLPAPTILSGAAGPHRLIWDLRYAAAGSAATVADDDEAGAGGVWAPPGDYQVRLTVGAVTRTQPLRLEPDPRVHLPRSAYEAQFALARRIEADLGAARAALHSRAGKGVSVPGDDVDATTLPSVAKRLRTLLTAVDGADGEPTRDAREGSALAHADLQRALGAPRPPP